MAGTPPAHRAACSPRDDRCTDGKPCAVATKVPRASVPADVLYSFFAMMADPPSFSRAMRMRTPKTRAAPLRIVRS